MENQNVPHDNGEGNENEKQVDYKKIYEIAKVQKVFICTILLYFILGFILGMTPLAPGGSAKIAIGVLFLGNTLVAIICTFLICVRVSGVGSAIIFCLTLFIPLIGLLVMLLINGKATKKIKEAGFNVGFLGAELNEIKQKV